MTELIVAMVVSWLIAIGVAIWLVHEVIKKSEDMFNCNSDEEDWK